MTFSHPFLPHGPHLRDLALQVSIATLQALAHFVVAAQHWSFTRLQPPSTQLTLVQPTTILPNSAQPLLSALAHTPATSRRRVNEAQ